MTPTPLARLLIVDDEAAQMTALCHTLEEEGYSTTGFSSAKEALRSLHQGEFDLVLTDLMMPEMDGISLLRSALEVDPDLVGILTTGHGTIDTAVEAMKAGALDYILKPFKLSVILPVLSRALSVRRLRMENKELARRVSEQTVQMKAANEELEAFSYSVSHDLRTPLRHIMGYADLLHGKAAPVLNETCSKYLQTISESAMQMSQLIDDLLEFSRMSRAEMQHLLCDPNEIIQEVLQGLARDLQDRQIEWKLDPLPSVSADRALFRQVWLNLLSNAVKYTRHRTPARIAVGFAERDKEHEFYVRDNGAGFDMAFAGKLFGVFQRLHRDDEFEGTGVGLANVRRIMLRHGGRVWAEAERDVGATFYIALPKRSASLSPPASEVGS